MNRIASLSVLLCALAGTTCLAGEIDYIEDFSLADDRTVPLKQLIPGTEAYYYYHCLHYQNNEQFDKVDELLAAWIKRHNHTARVNEIRYRQALLTYEKNPQKSLEFIRQQLGINFNHQRDKLGFKPNLPMALDQKKISRETLTKIARTNYDNLEGFEDSALDWLTKVDLNSAERRHLIQRLQRPDYDNVVDLVVADLNYQYSRGFGAAGLHSQLLLSQLDDLLKRKPDLLNKAHFVNAYVAKLRPEADVDWHHDVAAHTAYLDRLSNFVELLAPVHNSLKAHVLYHQLLLDRSQGVYDKDRFMAYVKLPRHVSYINSDYMKLEDSKRFPANLAADYGSQTLLPPVGNDEPLVRSYLHHFFVKEKTYKPYETYINDLYLKHNFAETKIVNGLGEPEEWYSMLPPATYQQLKERIDLDFAYTNETVFAAGDPVSLDVNVKHVKSLIVKVYKINATNFYRETLREVDTDINLDGLVANIETTHEYAEPPLRRVGRHFDFPTLTKPGVYVIDFIGNGKSSRALIRKGKLRHLVRTTTAGQVFTVMNEKNEKLDGAAIWLAGHEYKAGEDGLIAVPFSNQPGPQPIVISHGGLSSLADFDHEAESYSLVAGIYVDRGSLLKRQKAQVLVHPGLYLNGTPVTLSVLEDVKLTITSVDHDGVSTSKEVSDFELFEDRESTFEFQTPARLASISFALTAKVKNLSQAKKVDLAASQSFSLNQIDQSDKIEDLHFSAIDGKYAVDLLGKSGEPLGDRPVQFTIKHRDFRHNVALPLQTDDHGRVHLGELKDIAWVEATSPQGTSHRWSLLDDQHTYHQTVNGEAGGSIRVAYLGGQDKPTRDELSLLELRGGTFVADRFDSLAIKDGLLHVNKLPRGNYDLLLKSSGTRIRLCVSKGVERDGYVLSENRQLELRGGQPLQIAKVDVDDEELKVHLTNANKFARVHVFATRYQPAFSAYGNLARVQDAEPYVISVTKAKSNYVAGRNIGDEYRYIIDRKYAQKYPGNMLIRPSLLLNPWAIRTTETSQQYAAPGEDFAGEGSDSSGGGGRGPAKDAPPTLTGDFANLDFLSEGTAVIVNVAPNEDGTITIKRELLGAHQHIHVVAVDPHNTVYRSLSLPEVNSDMRDLRLVKGLDPDQHFAQQKQVSIVKAKDEFVLSDITTSKFEAYDNLSRIYTLYATLSQDPKLLEFSFILNWPNLKPEEKQTLYSTYACHELSFFIYERDPDFFKETVKPYLRNKKDKTFLDHWLLGDKLDEYLKPWNHAQLNTVEQVLLAQRIKGELKHTSRLVTDRYNLLPPDLDRFAYLFNTAVQGSSLDTDDVFGLEKAKSGELHKLIELQEKLHDGKLGNDKGDSGGGASAPGGRGGPGDRDADPADAPARTPPAKPSSKPEAEKKAKEADERGRRSQSRNNNADGYFEEDRKRISGDLKQYYRKLEKTKEWVENNYYKLPIEQQIADLVNVNSFWCDYASHAQDQSFYSSNFADAAGNFTEMMFALSVLDLPLEAAEHKSKFEGTEMTLTAAGPIVVFHEEILPTHELAKHTTILVSQNFFRHGDRYQHVDNVRIDKYVSDEFLVQTVYGCQVVVTNPTSSPQKLDVLLQVPVGAIPVLNGKYTRSVHIDLQPFNTTTVDYYFYFPKAGEYSHYPVQVANNEKLVAFAEAFTFKVVTEPSKIDRESWDYVSQHGSSEDVYAYLNEHNLLRTNLERIAFRMADKPFFEKAIDLLTTRHVYNDTLWSYGIKHDNAAACREYLQHANNFVNQCGSYIDTPLLTIDPVVRKTYQHMDYKPLVNARAHQLGRRRQILNDRFFGQYHRLLKVLSYRRDLSDDDLMAVTYYTLLQDRVEEALAFFEKVNVNNLATRLQYDYFTAYINLYLEDTASARQIAQKYADHPVDRWRNAFAAVTAQLDEIDGAESAVVDDDDRDQTQTDLAASSASFDFAVESKQVKLNYQNLDSVTVNYYLMDIELLFSRNPFVQRYSGQFSYIIPNGEQTLDLDGEKRTLTFELPEDLHNRNVLVEIVGGGQTKSQAYYSHSLALQAIENYGQVRVTHGETGKPISKTYVKVYAQMQDGSVRFYKDGYTDLRGRFDYTSLNTNELDIVSKFSLLVMSDEYGAVVREANPPKR